MTTQEKIASGALGTIVGTFAILSGTSVETPELISDAEVRKVVCKDKPIELSVKQSSYCFSAVEYKAIKDALLEEFIDFDSKGFRLQSRYIVSAVLEKESKARGQNQIDFSKGETLESYITSLLQ